jgi:hypothetical protein
MTRKLTVNAAIEARIVVSLSIVISKKEAEPSSRIEVEKPKKIQPFRLAAKAWSHLS